MKRYLFLWIVSYKWEHQEYWHLLFKQRLYKCYKVYEDYIEFDIEQAESTKNVQIQKASFPKE